MQDQPLSHDSSFHHIPVMGNNVLEAIETLSPEMLNGGLIIDATVGGGGHASLILERYKRVHLIGLDQDANARKASALKLKDFNNRVKIIETNFADFKPSEKAILVLADLGVNSSQLDNKERGFSFRIDGPLDMRMNQNQDINASELISHLDEQELADLIYNYGEERLSRRIARRIKTDLSKRPYTGTLELAYSIAGCYPPKKRNGRIHPATKTFQALRIGVNNELKVLERFLYSSPEWLCDNGLVCIISFHSLEDRRVKQSFLRDERLERLTKKPLIPQSEEVATNPRSRSAKLRIARKK